MQEELIKSFGILALHELCSYIDLEGNPVICDWEAYESQKELEYNHYYLTKEQFELIKDYLEKTYKGML